MLTAIKTPAIPAPRRAAPSRSSVERNRTDDSEVVAAIIAEQKDQNDHEEPEDASEAVMIDQPSGEKWRRYGDQSHSARSNTDR